ncbi:MAG TPA: hypothetical protein PKC25_03130, partial [Candidatus Rifleibacterium sp.]|nr:hypothetical protein [Candidatus Rifleibacterium sp.]
MNMNEDSPRIENDHILLEYNLSESAGKLLVKCQKTTDLILEIVLMVVLSLPFTLGDCTLLSRPCMASAIVACTAPWPRFCSS